MEWVADEMRRAVITGPTGAIGTALVKLLTDNGVEVAAVCRQGSGRIHNIPASDKVRIVGCSLDGLHALPGLLTGHYDVFYHFAWAGTTGMARDDTDAQVKNIQYTMDAVEAAKEIGCTKFIGAGSQAEYGRHPERLSAATATFPESAYGMAKLCAGQMGRLRCRQLGMGHIWGRVLSVYGPCDGEGSMVMSVLRDLLEGRRPSCTEGGQVWDYLYSEDAARAFYLLGERGLDQKTYCIGSGTARPLAWYIRKIRDAVDPRLGIGLGEIPYSEGQVMHLCADISELTADTGFVPRHPFEEGIRETLRWYRAHMGERSGHAKN